MSELDSFSSDLVRKYSAPEAPAAAATSNTDPFSKALIAKTLASAKGQVDPLVLDSSKEWDFFRQVVDGASFGAYSASVPARIAKPADAWKKEHSGQAMLANTLGQTIPEVVASTLLGQGEVALAKLAEVPELARFLTGSSEGN